MHLPLGEPCTTTAVSIDTKTFVSCNGETKVILPGKIKFHPHMKQTETLFLLSFRR